MQELGLEPIDDVRVGGLGGTESVVPLYIITLAVQPFPPVTLPVLAHAGEPWVLLGRDVLNTRRLLLDGPNLVLEPG